MRYIASTALIEQNAKAVNQIYLATIGRSGEDVQFDATQAANLLYIAGQCPLVGGNPVYQARSLYSLVDDQAEFDDALICMAAGYVVKSLEETAPSVTVYPNPNRTGQQFFEFKGLLDEEAVITVQLFDAQGRQILDQRLAGAKESVDVSGLAQGLYNWVISIDGRLLSHGKVTIF